MIVEFDAAFNFYLRHHPERSFRRGRVLRLLTSVRRPTLVRSQPMAVARVTTLNGCCELSH